MFFFGFFCGFYRRGGAALCGGISSPPAAAKTVRAISRIEHQLGKVNASRSLRSRSAVILYSTLGSKTNWRFRLGDGKIFNPI